MYVEKFLIFCSSYLLVFIVLVPKVLISGSIYSISSYLLYYFPEVHYLGFVFSKTSDYSISDNDLRYHQWSPS